MGEFFLRLLNMSIAAGWLILAVLCVRFLFRKMPKWVNCVLWGTVAVRLIFPFAIESEFSLQPSAGFIQSSTVVEGEILNYVPSVDSSIPVVENTLNPMLQEIFFYQASESVAPLQVVMEVAGYVWVCGMLVLILIAMGSMMHLRFSVREAVCCKDNVYICDAVKSPFILGVIRPRIYLSSGISEEEMNYIIAHEQAHIKRKDHFWKLFGYLLLCVYWFNPLCVVAYIMLCKDVELACDEKVIRNMSFADKKEYSRILLSCATQRKLVLVCPLAFGEVGVKERVKSVLNYKKPTFWITFVAILVCAILAICFLTNPSREYQIGITIPAGSTAEFCYSDEEVCAEGNALIIANGEGLSDTLVTLLPVEGQDIEVGEEIICGEAVYMTPGMPVKMEVEKGEWFKIGVNMQNSTPEDKVIYVSVRGVKELRISSVDNAVKKEEAASETFLVYALQCDEEGLVVDMIEWILVPSERADELGITLDDGPNGFYIYNETSDILNLPLAEKCECQVLDWEENYVPKEVTMEEMMDIMAERIEKYNGNHSPYHVTVKNGKIVKIMEQYLP